MKRIAKPGYQKQVLRLIKKLGSFEAVAARLHVTSNSVRRWSRNLNPPNQIARVAIDRLEKEVFEA